MQAAVRSSALRAAALVAAAVALAAVHLPGRPPTLCLLRAATGVPCPLCGGTTAAVRAGSGDLLGALRASPVVVLAGVLLVVAPFLRLREVTARQAWLAVGATAVAAELWQLARFGLL